MSSVSTDFLPYQRGMIQQHFLNLEFVLSQIWKIKTGKNQKAFKKLGYNDKIRKISKYFPKDVVTDLKTLGRIRNLWVKKDDIEETKITNLLKFKSKFIKTPNYPLKNRKEVFIRSFFAIQDAIILLNNIEPMKTWWRSLGT